MTIELIRSHNIGQAYMTPIAYGDYSGLTGEEIELVDLFLSKMPSEAVFDFEDEEPSFNLCGITGCYGLCIRLDVFTPKNEG